MLALVSVVMAGMAFGVAFWPSGGLWWLIELFARGVLMVAGLIATVCAAGSLVLWLGDSR
jgi:hypothetical protein